MASKIKVLTIFFVILIALFRLAGCSENRNKENKCRLPILSIRNDLPVLAIYETGMKAGEEVAYNFYDEIALIVYADGQIIWFSGQAGKENMLCSSKISTVQVEAVIKKLENNHVFSENRAWKCNYPPDASYETIAVFHQGNRLMWRSCHELFEDDPNLVVTSEGIKKIPAGQTRDQVLSNEPQEYREFLHDWTTTKELLKTLIPQECEEIEVTITAIAIENEERKTRRLKKELEL